MGNEYKRLPAEERLENARSVNPEALKNYEVAAFLKEVLLNNSPFKLKSVSMKSKVLEINGWTLEVALTQFGGIREIISMESPSGLFGERSDWYDDAYEINPWDLLSGKEQLQLMRILR